MGLSRKRLPRLRAEGANIKTILVINEKIKLRLHRRASLSITIIYISFHFTNGRTPASIITTLVISQVSEMSIDFFKTFLRMCRRIAWGLIFPFRIDLLLPCFPGGRIGFKAFGGSPAGRTAELMFVPRRKKSAAELILLDDWALPADAISDMGRARDGLDMLHAGVGVLRGR